MFPFNVKFTVDTGKWPYFSRVGIFFGKSPGREIKFFRQQIHLEQHNVVLGKALDFGSELQ